MRWVVGKKEKEMFWSFVDSVREEKRTPLGFLFIELVMNLKDGENKSTEM